MQLEIAERLRTCRRCRGGWRSRLWGRGCSGRCGGEGKEDRRDLHPSAGARHAGTARRRGGRPRFQPSMFPAPRRMSQRRTPRVHVRTARVATPHSPCRNATRPRRNATRPRRNATLPVLQRHTPAPQRHTPRVATPHARAATPHSPVSQRHTPAPQRHTPAPQRHTPGVHVRTHPAAVLNRNVFLTSAAVGSYIFRTESKVVRSSALAAVGGTDVLDSTLVPYWCGSLSLLLLPRSLEVCTRLGQSSTGRIGAWPGLPAGGRLALVDES
jgi:hypothetical protein